MRARETWRIIVLGCLVTSTLPLCAYTQSTTHSSNTPCEGADIDKDYCFRCHSNTTQLINVISELWRVEDMLVEPAKYARSNHAELNCLECHAYTWPFFPHQESVRNLRLSCLQCHQGEDKFAKFRFHYIEQQYNRSVHEENLPDTFSCFSCHDPHEFDIADPDDEIRYTIENSNRLCRKCHASLAEIAILTTRKLPRLEEGHSWLPGPDLHWKHVRCVECHTPHEEHFSHRILSAKTAERMCEKCHTKDSILLTKLYKHRVSETKQNYGFVNMAVFNDAYIIGMTRNIYLDWAFLAFIGLVVMGVGGHAGLRIITWKWRKKHGK